MVNTSVLKIAEGLRHEVSKSYVVSTDSPQQSSGNFTKSADNDPYDTMTIVLICVVSGIASLLTVGGNVLVIVSFIINRALRTLNNYLILSLAAADLVIGAISINLFTIYIVKGGWTLGNTLCDVWLALDYVASHASVMNLLIICLDRYYSVTNPIKSRFNKTHKRYVMAIISAWTISVVVWAPGIFFWQYIVDIRTVPQNECYIQFIKDSKGMTVVTALVSFYIPAIVMCCLYYKVYLEIKKRRKRLLILKAEKVPRKQILSLVIVAEQVRKTRSMKAADHDDDNSLIDKNITNSRKSNPLQQNVNDTCSELSLTTSDGNKTTGNLTSHVDTSKTNPGQPQESFKTHLLKTNSVSRNQQQTHFHQVESDAEEQSAREQRRQSEKCLPTDSNYKALPSNHVEKTFSTKMANRWRQQSVKKNIQSLKQETKAARLLASILAAFILLWLPYNIMVLIEPFCAAESGSCIPNVAWNVGYWLCYINSTLNPICYALCNKTFRHTFVYILTMKWNRPGRRNLSLNFV